MSDSANSDDRPERKKRRRIPFRRASSDAPHSDSASADSGSRHFDLAEEDPDWDAAWEGYAAGKDASMQSNLGQLKAVVQLATSRVELRGEFDQEVVAVLGDLVVERSAVEDDSEGPSSYDHKAIGVLPRLTLRLASQPEQADESSGTWELERDEAGVVAVGNGTEALMAAVWAQLLHISEELSPTALHLRLPCLELNGYGLVLCGGTLTQREQLTDELIRSGASYLTADDLVLVEGTRTAFGSPSPRRSENAAGERRFEAASATAQVVAQCAVGLIVVLEEQAVHPTSSPRKLAPLSMAQTAIELLQSRSVSDSQPGPSNELALEMAALLVAGSSCVSVSAPTTQHELDHLLRELNALHPPVRRRLAVLYWLLQTESCYKRLAEQAGSTARMIRFDQDALIFESQSQSHEDSDSSSERTSPQLLSAHEADELLARSELEGAQKRPRVWPTPGAFGLTDCPMGPSEHQLWEGLSLPVSEQLDALPSGVAVELLSRDLLEAPTATRDRILHAHVLAQRHANEVAGALIWVLRVAAEVDVKPVIFGSFLQVWDGRLPEHFTDVGRLDLLIRSNEIDLLLERLRTQGFQSDARKLSKKASSAEIEYRLRHPAIPDVTINLHSTLAAGPFGQLVDPDEFHHRALPVAVRGQWVLGLHPEHRFIAACVSACGGRIEDASSVSAVAGTPGGAARLGRAEPSDDVPRLAQLREVVLTAPSSEESLMSAVECSSRLGATTKVFSAVRQADEQLPGLPTWLVQRARQEAGLPTEPTRGLKDRLRGQGR